MQIHKPPHHGMLRWPSDDGWPFDYDATYTVYFDPDSKFPLSPFNQALRGGLTFGMELLYPKLPWASISAVDAATAVILTGREHKKNQTKLLRKLRQWGNL
jgi:hypothetical protein